MIARTIVFVVVGAVLGALLGRTRSCTDGACPLTSTPKRGALWGGFLGLLVALTVATGPYPSTGAEAAESGPAAAAAGAPAKPYLDVADGKVFREKVLEHPGAAVVYFHAPWCGACKAYAPIFDKVARTKAKQARFVKVDTDKAPDLAGKYSVQYLPTTVVFLAGKPRDRFVGVASERELVEALQKVAREQARSERNAAKEVQSHDN